MDDHRLKDLSRVGEGLIYRLIVQILMRCCLALRRTTRSDSRSRKRISEQRSAIAIGLSMVSDWRSSRSATAPIRRELTSRRALTREIKGKSSSTVARAKAVREPKCCSRASACF